MYSLFQLRLLTKAFAEIVAGIRQMQSRHSGRSNKGIGRLEFSLIARSVHANGDGGTQQGMTGIPAGQGMVSESPRPPQGQKTVDNATSWKEDSARLRGFLCHSHAGFNTHLASCPRSPD